MSFARFAAAGGLVSYGGHDALEFPDGQIVLLTDLFEDQEATVLQLPAQPYPSGEDRGVTRPSRAFGRLSIRSEPGTLMLPNLSDSRRTEWTLIRMLA